MSGTLTTNHEIGTMPARQPALFLNKGRRLTFCLVGLKRRNSGPVGPQWALLNARQDKTLNRLCPERSEKGQAAVPLLRYLI